MSVFHLLSHNGLKALIDKITAYFYTKTEADDLLDDKVDKVNGKGLSTEDYTPAEKNKLSNIEAGAEVNVQSDWNESDSTDDAYIKNKPSIPTATSDLTNDSNFVSDSDYVHTDNNYTSAEKSKLSGIESGAEVNVQSNWNETDSTADAYIANKPDIDSLKVLVVTLSAFSSLPATFYETAVTADHVCIKAELGTPSAQTGDWTVTTSAGELTISGSISGSTTATLYLAIKQ